jgi:pimeloyl-ACP methyl ester carboxylesterase
METLNDSIRSALPGSFKKLTDGVVHYEIEGPEKGDLVVLIHGLSTPMFAWDPTFKALVESGFRVLRYDIFGRGYSDRPNTAYSMELFIRQLEELLSSIDTTQKVHLIGWSMGGAISAAFADQYPERVDKITFIAPAGFPVNMPASAKLLTIPVLGKILMTLVGEKSLLKSIDGLFFDTTLVPDYIEQFKVQMRYKGFLQAIHSTICHFPFNTSDTFKRIGQQKRPTLLIWGEGDEVTPFSNSKMAREVMPDTEFLSVSEAKHAVHYENPDIVNPKIIAFLNDQNDQNDQNN